MLSRICLAAALIGGTGCTGAAAESADDRKWINECLADNKNAKVSIAVVTAYCTCMNNKMSDSETRSITQWEKANPGARKACDKEAGWE